MPENNITLWQYIWGIFSIPMAWMWGRQNTHQKVQEEMKEELAAHKLHNAETTFNKKEVAAIVSQAVTPIKESVTRIETSVNKLIDREMRDRD